MRKDNQAIAGLIIIPAIHKIRFPSGGKAITLAIVVIVITIVGIVIIILTVLLVYLNDVVDFFVLRDYDPNLWIIVNYTIMIIVAVIEIVSHCKNQLLYQC